MVRVFGLLSSVLLLLAACSEGPKVSAPVDPPKTDVAVFLGNGNGNGNGNGSFAGFGRQTQDRRCADQAAARIWHPSTSSASNVWPAKGSMTISSFIV